MYLTHHCADMNATLVGGKILSTDVVLSVLKIVITIMNIMYTKYHMKTLPRHLLVIVVNPSTNHHITLGHLYILVKKIRRNHSMNAMIVSGIHQWKCAALLVPRSAMQSTM